MRELPLLMSGPMVRATLDGRKTVTRRVLKPQYATEAWSVRPKATPDIAGRTHDWWLPDAVAPASSLPRCPYGKVGDRLWVREAWRAPASLDEKSGAEIAESCLAAGYRMPWCPIRYEADGALNSAKDWRGFGSTPGEAVPGRYRHARFMPRWASRITLEVTAVRVERLQDISEGQALNEGIRELPLQANEPGAWWCSDPLGNPALHCRTPRAAFCRLWESINGAGSWADNPWVWCISFRRVEAR